MVDTAIPNHGSTGYMRGGPGGTNLNLVARAGIEPATFRFSGGRSYQLSYLAGRHPLTTTTCLAVFGDPDGTRTRDLRRDRAAR